MALKGPSRRDLEAAMLRDFEKLAGLPHRAPRTRRREPPWERATFREYPRNWFPTVDDSDSYYDDLTYDWGDYDHDDEIDS